MERALVEKFKRGKVFEEKVVRRKKNFATATKRRT